MTHHTRLTEPALAAITALELFCADPTDAHLDAFNDRIDGDQGLTTHADRIGFLLAIFARLVADVRPPAGSYCSVALVATDGTDIVNIDSTGMDPVDIAVANAADDTDVSDVSAFLYGRDGEPFPISQVVAALIRFRIALAGHSHIVGVGPR